MDGRTVKEDTVERGRYSVVAWMCRAAETSDEGRSTTPLCTRGGDVGGCSQGARAWGGGREEANSLGFWQVMRGPSDDGLSRGSEGGDPSMDVLKGKRRAPRERDAL